MQLNVNGNYKEPYPLVENQVSDLPVYLNIDDECWDQYIDVSFAYIPVSTEPVWLEPLIPLAELPEHFFDSSYTEL